jgi:hypothetical protein
MAFRKRTRRRFRKDILPARWQRGLIGEPPARGAVNVIGTAFSQVP